MAGPAPLSAAASSSPPGSPGGPRPRYEEWILETIDSLRSRKARPDLERICRMVRRRHGPEPERTRQELERMVQRRAVLRVSYKGSISYRNAARLQPPRRARGGGKAGAPDGVAGGGSSPKPEAQGLGSPAREQEDGGNPKPGPEEVGSPKDTKIRVQAEESYKHSNFGALDGGSPKEVKFGGLGGWNPIDDSRGVLGAGPKEGTFGGLGDGTSWVHGSPKDGTCGMLGMGIPKGPAFGMQGFGVPKDVLFGGKGSGSPKDGKLGEGTPKGASSWVQDLETPKEVRFGELGCLEPKNGKLGGRSPNEERPWMQAELSPREVASGIQGGWCPKDGRLGNIKDGKFGVLGGRSPKEVVSGMQQELSPKDGTLGVQVRATSKDTVSGVVREVGPRDGHLGVQGRRSPNSGSLGVQGDSGLRNWKLGMLEATTPKDGKVPVGEGRITKEVMLGSKDGARWGQVEVNTKEGRFGDPVEVAFGVQDRLGMFGEDRCVIQEKAGMLGELGVQDKHVLLDNRRLGLQGTLGMLGEGSPKNLSCGMQGHGISKEVDLWEARPRQIGSLSSEFQGKESTKYMEKGFACSVGRGSCNELEKGRPKDMGKDSAREVTKGLMSTEPGVRKENGFIEECQDLLAKGCPRLTSRVAHAEESSESQDSMLGENTPHCHGESKVPKEGTPGLPKHGSPASPDDKNLEVTGGQGKNLRRVKRGTMGPEEEEPPVKKLRTESPEPGGERSRRSLGAASITEVPLAPTTRSGSRRPLNSAPAPRVERLTRARGRWQQEEEERVRPQRSRSRPDRNAGRPQESPGSSSQGGRATRSKKVEEEQTKEEGEEDVSMLSEGSEVPDVENETAENCVEDKSTKTPLDSAEPELDRGTEPPTSQNPCEEDSKMERSSTNGLSVATDTEQGPLVEKSFSSYAAVQHLSETTDNTFSRDKNESMCKTHTGPNNNCEKGCATHLLSIVKNTNGCSTNIGALDKNSSVFDSICPRVKREEGCNTSVCPLGECAVKAVPVETVKLEEDAGEPRDCEASLGIEGVEPHLPIRVSPVTPMVLTMDRTSYKKISVNKKPSDPVCWSVMDVVQYFTDAGFAEQASAFQEQEIDGKSLLLMQRTDVLTGLSIRLGPALKMYEHHIKILQQCHFTEASGFLD
ncbi:sterile alpha motif domain-containing protein 1 [Lissotriton helveticus]